MARVTLNVPNPDLTDVLDALERQWSKEASRINPGYSELSPQERAAACLGAYVRSITKGHRRTKEVERRRRQELPILVSEPDIS